MGHCGMRELELVRMSCKNILSDSPCLAAGITKQFSLYFFLTTNLAGKKKRKLQDLSVHIMKQTNNTRTLVLNILISIR